MPFQIAGIPEADAVLDDPFALVVGMLLDQQYGMEHAFRGPWKLKSRLGTIDPTALVALDPDAFVAAAIMPPAIHRYGRSMAGRVLELAKVVANRYGGDAARIWTDATSGDELITRIRELPGFGEQKAKILVALLAKQLGVRPEGWEQVAGDYALPGYRSVADVVDADSLQRVRDFKKAARAPKGSG